MISPSFGPARVVPVSAFVRVDSLRRTLLTGLAWRALDLACRISGVTTGGLMRGLLKESMADVCVVSAW